MNPSLVTRIFAGFKVAVRNALPVRRIESIKSLACIFDSLADG
jgi:hypothetical protein